MGAFGITDETFFTLRYPRMCDETAPTFRSAMEVAAEMVEGGAEKVSIGGVQIIEGCAYENGTVYAEVETHSALPEEGENE